MYCPLAQGLTAMILPHHIPKFPNPQVTVSFLSVRWQPHMFVTGNESLLIHLHPLEFYRPKFQTSHKHQHFSYHQSILLSSVLTIPDVWADLWEALQLLIYSSSSSSFCCIFWLLILFHLRSGPLVFGLLPIHISSLPVVKLRLYL